MSRTLVRLIFVMQKHGKNESAVRCVIPHGGRQAARTPARG